MKRTNTVWICLLFATSLLPAFAQNVQINGHTFIDLGLPSGMLWAEANIGATSSTDIGEYFSWGETQIKKKYSWPTYLYGKRENKMTKYTSSDSKTVLETGDDAASVIWGEGCRMPTLSDFVELRDTSNCIWTWTNRTMSNGQTIKGYVVSSRSNSNSIFLPACGCKDGKTLDYYDAHGFYWSSTRNAIYDYYAFFLCLEPDCFYNSYDSRSYGLSIRPVAENPKEE